MAHQGARALGARPARRVESAQCPGAFARLPLPLRCMMCALRVLFAPFLLTLYVRSGVAGPCAADCKIETGRQVPLLFKHAVDALNEAVDISNGEMVVVPIGLLLAYGGARTGAGEPCRASLFALPRRFVAHAPGLHIIRWFQHSSMNCAMLFLQKWHSKACAGSRARFSNTW